MGLSLSLLGPRHSSSSDNSAAILHDEVQSHSVCDFVKETSGDCQAEKHSGGEGLTGNIVQDVSSDSDSDIEVEIDAEEVAKLGDNIWLHKDYLAYLSKLVATKLTFIEEKSKWDIERIPIDPRRKRARKIREGWRDGCYDAREKAYFDDYAKDSSAVEWCTIQM
ncbi:g4991 [Coccomyxa elongata]